MLTRCVGYERAKTQGVELGKHKNIFLPARALHVRSLSRSRGKETRRKKRLWTDLDFSQSQNWMTKNKCSKKRNPNQNLTKFRPVLELASCILIE